MKNSPKKIPEKLQNARDAFDYIVKMSFDKVKSGGRIDSEFIAIAYMPGDDHFSIIPVPLADTIDEAQRNDVMALFAEDLAAQGADAYIFIAISEVWISERVAESSGKNKMEGLVASAHESFHNNTSHKFKSAYCIEDFRFEEFFDPGIQG